MNEVQGNSGIGDISAKGNNKMERHMIRMLDVEELNRNFSSSLDKVERMDEKSLNSTKEKFNLLKEISLHKGLRNNLEG